MSRNSDYKNLKELTKSLSLGIEKLELGNLGSEELTLLLEDARTLYERITVLQYLAFDKEVKDKKIDKSKRESKKPKPEIKKAQGSFELNFGTPVTEDQNEDQKVDLPENETHSNQINLLDAIEEHVVEDEFVVEEKEILEKGTEDEQEAATSINEKFANEASKKTLADKLSRQPISNLKEAIGLNQKFLFMNDLFEGENTDFNEAVETINNFSNLESAIEYIDDKLVPKYKWNKEHKSVVNFIDLVERRFMA